MPYTTERGVTSYSDRDTPAEYATGQDEDAARFNYARDLAYASADAVATQLDDLYDAPIADKAAEMEQISDALAVLLGRVRALTQVRT